MDDNIINASIGKRVVHASTVVHRRMIRRRVTNG